MLYRLLNIYQKVKDKVEENIVELKSNIKIAMPKDINIDKFTIKNTITNINIISMKLKQNY
ncbi:hypothetical protein RCA_01215 [Rickettsia canadensis str. CA410]|uniref:Uncharacterized protein n=1 Tax=Rickettsia canadensis str. CA410 TaxID=1105107 RepID=A0ABM5MR30_RICCA|nr:hypothetical protein RCA_01215 [Rickettsia canadensis str. CA410]